MATVLAATMYVFALFSAVFLLAFGWTLTELFRPRQFRRRAYRALSAALVSRAAGLEVAVAAESDAFWGRVAEIERRAGVSISRTEQRQLEHLGLLVAYGRVQSGKRKKRVRARARAGAAADRAFAERIEQLGARSVQHLVRRGPGAIRVACWRLRLAALRRYGPAAVGSFQTVERRVFRWIGSTTVVIVVLALLLGGGPSDLLGLQAVNDLVSTVATAFLALWMATYVLPILIRWWRSGILPEPTRGSRVAVVFAVLMMFGLGYALAFGWLGRWSTWTYASATGPSLRSATPTGPGPAVRWCSPWRSGTASGCCGSPSPRSGSPCRGTGRCARSAPPRSRCRCSR